MVRESEEKFRFITEKMSDIVWTTDRNLRTTYVSPSIEKLLGFTPEERKRQSLEELMTPESLKRVQAMFLEELQRERDEDRHLSVEIEYCRKDGSTLWMENRVKAIWDSSGDIAVIHGVSRDITERKRFEEELDNSFKRLRAALGATIQAVAITVETRDPYTAGHQRRVADLSRAIATEMGLDINRTDGIRMAGVIHDLGKMAVPAEILSKPSRLSEIEYKLIKIHPQAGYDILKDVEFPWPIARIVLQHHERLNGSGYPAGLKGEEILMEARVIAVADVVEAIASYRPYRPAQGMEKALGEITQNKGILYDPAVADACLRLFRERGYKFV